MSEVAPTAEAAIFMGMLPKEIRRITLQSSQRGQGRRPGQTPPLHLCGVSLTRGRQRFHKTVRPIAQTRKYHDQFIAFRIKDGASNLEENRLLALMAQCKDNDMLFAALLGGNDHAPSFAISVSPLESLDTLQHLPLGGRNTTTSWASRTSVLDTRAPGVLEVLNRNPLRKSWYFFGCTFPTLVGFLLLCVSLFLLFLYRTCSPKCPPESKY